MRGSQKWRANITLAGKHYNLGTYHTLAEAAEARREAEIELFDPILEKYGWEPTSEDNYQENLEKALKQAKEAKRKPKSHAVNATPTHQQHNE